MDTSTLGLVVVGGLLALVLLVGLFDLRRRRPVRQVGDAAVSRGLGAAHRHSGGGTPAGLESGGGLS